MSCCSTSSCCALGPPYGLAPSFTHADEDGLSRKYLNLGVMCNLYRKLCLNSNFKFQNWMECLN
eukprot:6027871-Prorocentrum_lima.AAC.1